MTLSSTSPNVRPITFKPAVLVNLPLILVGTAIVVYAVINAAWPSDFVNAPYNQTVSHQDRLTGHDRPADWPVETPLPRKSGYQLRRVLDGLVYYVLIQAVMAVIGLLIYGQRNFYLLLMVSGVYGIAYVAGLGVSTVGPLLSAGGFALILWGAVLGWLTSTR